MTSGRTTSRYTAVMPAAAAPASHRLLGDHRIAIHKVMAPTPAKRHDQFFTIALIKCATVTSVSREIRRKFKGRLTRQAPITEPRGTPIGPRSTVRTRALAVVDTPSVKLVSEILRWCPKQKTLYAAVAFQCRTNMFSR